MRHAAWFRQGAGWARWAVGATLCLLLATDPLASGRSALAAGVENRAQLAALGRAYEEARLIEGADRLQALEALAAELENVTRGGLDAADRGAADFLRAQLALESGDAPQAAERFKQAGHDAGVFADDADFARIRALEAAGGDAEAAEEWSKWERRYESSPLRGEALLARAWNAMRRGKVGEAEAFLQEIGTRHSTLARDPRVALARGAAFYLSGKTAEALAELGMADDGPATDYLRALAHARGGSVLKAAALFKEVADRYPDSPMADPAALAKANVFLSSRDYRSAAQEFARVAENTGEMEIRGEASLRAAAAVFLAGAPDSALALLRAVGDEYRGSDVGARAQFLIGEIEYRGAQYEAAILDLNRVLTSYFDHAVAASAQYRVARCLAGLGREAEATSSYQAVVAGYPLSPEAPAAAYLAGVGLLKLERPLAAAPYFQLVIDRYAPSAAGNGALVFTSPENQELVEAALCLLELSYHRAGNLGQLAGAPHLLLERMPPSTSPWRAHALLFDADALAALGRYGDVEKTLERLFREFPDHRIGLAANRLLAWAYARQGRDSLAIATEERMIARYANGGSEDLSSAYLHIAHARFNQKDYDGAGAAYDDFAQRYPSHPERLLALYQAGLCYMRRDRAGDAVDRWEEVVAAAPQAPIAERAWARAGDLYFQAERYGDAQRCYTGLLDHFAETPAAAVAMLRLAQCDYNAGRDVEAIAGFARTMTAFPGSHAAREAERGTEQALYRLGQSDTGTAVLAQLVEQYPTSSFAGDAQFEIARKQYENEAYTEAAESFRLVVSRFPDHSAADRAQYLMADCHEKTGASTEARLAYEQFLSYFPDSDLRPAVRFRLGMMHFEAAEHLQAAIMFTGVLDDSLSADMSSAARFNLALCQRELGEEESALATLERYRSEYGDDERSALVSYQLGDLHAVAGRLPEAATAFGYGFARATDPALRLELGYRLGQCREQLGDTAPALEVYRQVAAGEPKDDPFRLSALARAAAIYEQRGDGARAAAAYRDIAQHTADRELAAAAAGRASELGSGSAGSRPVTD